MAAAYLDAAGVDAAAAGLAVAARNEQRWADVVTLARRGLHAPLTSSAGPAVRRGRGAARGAGRGQLRGAGRDRAGAAGGAGCGAGRAGDRQGDGAYRAGIEPGEPFRVRGADLIGAIADDLGNGVAREVIAARFHDAVVTLITDGCLLLRERHGLGTVALSGGVFQNLLLLHGATARLRVTRIPGVGALPGAVQRRRDQPRPGGGRGGRGPPGGWS